MNFKTVKKLISCALPAWLLLGSGQNLIGSGRFLLGSGGFMLYQVRKFFSLSFLVLYRFHLLEIIFKKNHMKQFSSTFLTEGLFKNYYYEHLRGQTIIQNGMTIDLCPDYQS